MRGVAIILGSFLPFAAALRVAVVGDAGETTPSQIAAFSEIHAMRPDLVLALGDNFYERGLEKINPSEETRVWGGLAPFPILGILGNHDQLGNRKAQTFVPAPFYQRKLTPEIQLIALDTTTLLFSDGIWNPLKLKAEPQWKWLKQVLSNSTPKWRIVIGHHPIHSATKHCSEKRKEKRQLETLLENAGVDLYLAGHTHCYERCSGNSTKHIVVGSTARLNSVRVECPEEHRCREAIHAHGWLMLTINSTDIHSEFHYTT